MSKNGAVIDYAEVEPIVFYRSILAEFPFIFLTVSLLILSLYLTYMFPQSIHLVELFVIFGKTVYLPIPFFLILPLVLMAITFHKLFDAKYVLGPDFIRATYGFLSFKKVDMRLEFVDIRGIEIHRGLYGRIVNTGTLHIGTAMKDEEELFVEKVYNPSQYRDLILKRRKEIQYEHEYKTDKL